MGVYVWRSRRHLIPATTAPPWKLSLRQTSSFVMFSFTSVAGKRVDIQRSLSHFFGPVCSNRFNSGLVSCSSLSSRRGVLLNSLPRCRRIALITNRMQCGGGIVKGKGLVGKNSDETGNAMQCNIDVENGSGIINKESNENASGVQCTLSVEKAKGIENAFSNEIAVGLQCNVVLKKMKGIADDGIDVAPSDNVKVNEGKGITYANTDDIGNSNFEVETGKGKTYKNDDEVVSRTRCYVGVEKENRTVDKDMDEEIQEVVALLRQCAKKKDLFTGNRLHLHITEKGMLRMNPAIGNSLMDMYAKCGKLGKAQNVFDSLPTQTVASWTVLISAYVQHGHFQLALNRYKQMLNSGYSPNVVTFTCILKACGSLGALEVGEEIHHRILKYGLLQKDTVLANSSVHMYAKAGALLKAQKVFDDLPVKPLESWTSLISGYTQHGNSEAALRCYIEMQRYGTSPSVVTFVCILRACGNIRALSFGQEIHEQIEKEHLLEKNIVIGNALVDMYAKCGLLRKAEEVFQKLSVRNVISWTTLMAGYVQHGYGLEALSCFEQMQIQEVYPNEVTLVCALKACGNARALSKGLEIHDRISRDVVLQKNSLVIGALIYMYSRCNMLELAKEVFNKTSIRDVTLWTTLIVGHVQNGCYEEALYFFEKMVQEGYIPNAATYSSILKACGIIGTAEKGHTLFNEIDKRELVKADTALTNSVLDMYAKTGLHEKAHNLFENFSRRDLVSWNTLVSGNAHLGKHEIVINLFNELITGGLIPDSSTFTSLLLSCNNAGLLDEAQLCFENMLNGSYGIMPTLEHHVCIVNLFGRAGQAEKAVIVFTEMPFSTHLTSWYAVMNDCHKWSNLGV